MATYNHTGSGGVELGGSAPIYRRKFYRGSGGLELSGSYSVALDYSYIGTGGLQIGGTAKVSTNKILEVSHVGEGGLLVSGHASKLFYQSGGVLPNQDWSIADSSEEDDIFLYSRLREQANPLATKELGPIAIGDLTEELDYQEWTLIYSFSTGKFFLNEEEIFTSTEAVKVDFTWDIWGYPVFVWVTSAGELKLRYRDWQSGIYNLLTLETEGCTDCFICLAERRLLWSYRNNKIYLAYHKDSQVLIRKFQEQEYGVPREISLVENGDNVPRIVGMGVTPSYKLQLRTRYSYAGRQE